MSIEEGRVPASGSGSAVPCASTAHYETLRDMIRADIAAGTLKPGERLVVEQLRRRYGASGQPIRDALNQLQGEGFVVVSANRGASVRVVDEDFVQNIFEIRSLLEPFLVQRYCRTCTAAMLRDLQRAQSRFEQAVAAQLPEAIDAANTEFHDLIFGADSNTEAVEALQRYAGMLQAYRAKLPVTLYRTQARIAEHRLILAALNARDPQAAATAAANHVKAAAEDFLQAMRQARVAKSTAAGRARAAALNG
jgi:DNA-binding GntR family transcriptional regulator